MGGDNKKEEGVKVEKREMWRRGGGGEEDEKGRAVVSVSRSTL